ncbi:MAG: SLBB domain-containing protein, partial [Acidobacteria bacterium]|nr:SLBB domain-containing protein [Acidobacteriota bacterium]
APEIQKSGYLVGPGDVISGKILGESQFDFIATIDEDGKFQVPFFEKSIMAKCRTEKELRSEVTQLLSKYLRSPLVSVSVTERRSTPPVVIYGEVRAPQQVALTRKARLLELLAFAGGVTEKSGGAIQVFHTQPPMCDETYEDGNKTTATTAAKASDGEDIPFRIYSLDNVQKGSEQSNPQIYPGDVIVVKEALPVFVLGEVVATGKVPLPEGGLPLTQVLATVGGVRPEAKTKDIKIHRLRSGSKEQERDIISVNYDLIRKGKQKDIMLSPYDIVEVGKAKKSIAQTILEIATGTARGVATQLPTRILY